MLTLFCLLCSMLPSAVVSFVPDAAPQGSWDYNYGGGTKGSWSSEDGHGVLRYRGDDRDYSGWTIHLEKPVNLSQCLEHGALRFRIRGVRGGEQVVVGLLDGTPQKPQVRLYLNGKIRLTAQWQEVALPLREFGTMGLWWNEERKVEMPAKIDWAKIQEFRISSDRGNNFETRDSTGIFEVRIADVRIDSAYEPPENARLAAVRAKAEPVPRIRVNTVGWKPDAAKRFLVAGMEDQSYDLLDSTGKSVHHGTLVPYGLWEAADEQISVGDFSHWNRNGIYRLSVGSELSVPFVIGNDVYDALAKASLQAFRIQRAVPLPASEFGELARSAHPDTALKVLSSGSTAKSWSAPGGWYDAGDYGKYVVSAGITCWELLLLHEMTPGGNPAALSEVLFETEWLERMQDHDGGVFFKVAPLHWSAFVMPENDHEERYVIGKSTSSALNFAAVLAHVSRRLPAGPHAAGLLKKARSAWKWALAHPAVKEPDEVGGSGAYDDAHLSDEFLWAATEIWLSSGKPDDRAEVVRRFSQETYDPDISWNKVQNLALYSLALSDRDDPLVKNARRIVETLADSVHRSLEGAPAQQPVDAFTWGSNSRILNQGVPLIVSRHLGGDRSRQDDLQQLLDYVLGRNALGRSFVTGFGVGAPKRPHQRLLGGHEAAPGFLTGGPNGGREDEDLTVPDGVVYPFRAPAASWVDQTEAYASNEIAINWNSALALVAGMLR